MLFNARDYLDLASMQLSGFNSKSTRDTLLTLSGDLLPLIHKLVYLIQSEDGIMEITIPQTKYEKDPLEFLLILKEFLLNSLKNFTRKEIINQMVELTSIAIYEIKFLK